MNVEYQLYNEVNMEIIFATDLEGDSEEITEERQKFAGYLSAIHNMSKKSIEIKKSIKIKRISIKIKRKIDIKRSIKSEEASR